MPMMSSKRSIRMLFDFLVLSILFFSYLCMISSHAADTITLGQQLRDGQTLVSSGDNFELGFFSPGSSKNRYLGIWYNYKKVSEPTVVWVGNRDNPLFDSSGFLTIDNNGNLMISDEKGSSVMMTSLSLTANTSAQLLDSGNLILRDSYNERQIFWQSFDHPTNTLLPGMKFGYNKKTKQNGLLRAWKNLEEASPGTFAFGADPNGTEQYFIWQRGDIYWTSGVWNGEIFSLVPEMSQTDIFGYSFVSNEDENYFTYYVKNVSIISRLVIDPSGQILQLTWLENRWNLFWSQPHHVCDAYLVCGAYSSCDPNGSPSCSCLIGFEPRFPRGWALRDWSGGCVRQRSLTCGNGDMFQRLKSMKLPDQSQLAGWALTDSTVGDDVCEAMCMGNCSCVAYARYNTTGCLVWDGDLLGLQSNYQGGGGAQDFFIRLASSEQDGQGNKGRWLVILAIVVLIVAIVAPIIAFSASVICYMQRRRMEQKRKKQTSQELLLLELGTNTVDGKKFGIPNNSGEGGEKDREFQLFSFLSIEAATDNFSTKNKLGEGGFGPVYKGKLHGEQEIAVKRLSRSSGQGLVEFKNEILLIAKLQHMNLVRLLGCCIEGEEKLLIYEYMPNKSLDSFLFDSTKQAFLDWGKRLHIVEGIAQGLLYLHRYSRLRIIHRDMKASNILLDGDMNPKISDFGMARIFGREESQANTNRVVGTYGYMPPEYVMEGLFSEKSDVFSFGVLLLEIVSGKKISGFYQSNNSLTLLGYAWELWMNGRGLELMDRTLGEPSPMWKLTRCIHVALLCVQERATDRPNMSDVIAMLGNETAVLPSPKQPAFSTRSVIDTNLERSKPEICSLNEVTISVLEAR